MSSTNALFAPFTNSTVMAVCPLIAALTFLSTLPSYNALSSAFTSSTTPHAEVIFVTLSIKIFKFSYNLAL